VGYTPLTSPDTELLLIVLEADFKLADRFIRGMKRFDPVATEIVSGMFHMFSRAPQIRERLADLRMRLGWTCCRYVRLIGRRRDCFAIRSRWRHSRKGRERHCKNHRNAQAAQLRFHGNIPPHPNFVWTTEVIHRGGSPANSFVINTPRD
jgi:hypothetical protein